MPLRAHRPSGASSPWILPNQLCLDGFEEPLVGIVIVTISFTTHQRLESGPAKYLMIIVRRVLVIVRVMDADFRRWPEGDSHI